MTVSSKTILERKKPQPPPQATAAAAAATAGYDSKTAKMVASCFFGNVLGVWHWAGCWVGKGLPLCAMVAIKEAGQTAWSRWVSLARIRR